jgi:hypothetical protein
LGFATGIEAAGSTIASPSHAAPNCAWKHPEKALARIDGLLTESTEKTEVACPGGGELYIVRF